MEQEFFDEMQRRIVKNFLDMLILRRLSERSMTGYGIIAFLNNKFHTLMSSGTIYNYLYLLERKGWIKGESTKRGTVYTLTKQGKENIRTFLNSKNKILGLVLNLFDGE